MCTDDAMNNWTEVVTRRYDVGGCYHSSSAMMNGAINARHFTSNTKHIECFPRSRQMLALFGSRSPIEELFCVAEEEVGRLKPQYLPYSFQCLNFPFI
jgi:hypothetical protein